MAAEVGITLAVVNTETLRVRSGPGTEEGVLGLVPNGEVLEVVEMVEFTSEEAEAVEEPLSAASVSGNDAEDENDPHVYDEAETAEEAPVVWVCVDYEGKDGYISAEYVTTSFHVDAGETVEEIKAREKAEAEAKRHVNYDAIATDADTIRLLGALIQCEAGGESYEGQIAVGAVVMNRVRSGAYPNTIYGVIFASGQFTPAMNGKVGTLYNSGKISQSCINAATEAINGVSNVGSCTHFRRNDGREGIVIGNHVFY
ncbi:MAG: cell wall hydrolase [Lachnospiraceae bacterium]|nr:cell wall hydrolase [Lachnospiraceae bacterium]